MLLMAIMRVEVRGTRNSICNKEHNYVVEFLIRFCYFVGGGPHVELFYTKS